ncbi:MAG: DUF6427 family protein [Cyclobacteriaceae bacterium]
MLRFFRINDPYRLLFIFLILIGIRIIQSYFIQGQFLPELKWLLLGEWLGKGFHMYREAYDYTGPLAVLIYKHTDLLFGRSPLVHHILSSLLIIVQAGIFNRILLKNKAFDENSYLPAFFYVILMLIVPDFMSFSPQLMSMTFVLLTLGSVLRRIDNQATDELFLNSGLFVGVATMIYPPAAIFFFVFLFSLIVFSSAIPRRLLLYLFGFVLIITLCIVYFFWRGDLSYFIEFFFLEGFMLDKVVLLGSWELLLICAPLGFVFLLSIFKSISASRLTNFQQRVQQVIWFMFLGGVSCFFLTNLSSGLELVFLTPLLAYFITHYFMLLKRRIFKSVMPGLVVFGLLGYNLFAYNSLLNSVLVQEVNAPSANILVLDEDFAYYLNKESGSPCFSKPLCQSAFQGLGYYETATNIYKWLIKANPDLIIDKIGVVPELFDRFPLIEKKYEKTDEGYYGKISN